MKFGAEIDPFGSRRRMAVFTVATLIAAVGIGLLGGAFRWCLDQADMLRLYLLYQAQGLAWGWVIPIVLVAACAAIGHLFTRLAPRASGSGIQDVEAVWHEQEDLPGPSVLPSRFFGGVIAIGSGMVMGREGPSVHLGSTIGAEVGRWFRLSDYERKLLYTTVGGAGLAVAFNAPVGGALFTIEEVTKSFRVRVILVTLMSTSVAVWVSRFIIPEHADFTVAPIPSPSVAVLAAYVMLGLVAGAVGVAYNALVMGMLRRTDRMRLHATTRAALIGGLIGLLLWFDPLAAGGGGDVAQLILGDQPFTLWALLALLAVRFVAGPLSYASGTPGGLFAPLLALGALLGSLFYSVAVAIGGEGAAELLGRSPVPFAAVGMVALFTASVRAPLTGIVLITEMTSTASLTLAMFAAAAAALFMTTALKGRPIYDSLRDRMLELRDARAGAAPAEGQ